MPVNQISIDSDVLIWYLRGNDDVAVQIEDYIAKGAILVASAIVVLEVLRGMRPNEVAMTRALLDTLKVIDVDASIIEEAYRLFHDRKIRGETLPFNDSIIAATALVGGAPLFTFNSKHYPANVLI